MAVKVLAGRGGMEALVGLLKDAPKPGSFEQSLLAHYGWSQERLQEEVRTEMMRH